MDFFSADCLELLGRLSIRQSTDMVISRLSWSTRLLDRFGTESVDCPRVDQSTDGSRQSTVQGWNSRLFTLSSFVFCADCLLGNVTVL